MNNRPLPYEELTPLEQCIANKSLFVRMLENKAREQALLQPMRAPEEVEH